MFHTYVVVSVPVFSTVTSSTLLSHWLESSKATAQNDKGTLTMQLFTDEASGQTMLRIESKGLLPVGA